MGEQDLEDDEDEEEDDDDEILEEDDGEFNDIIDEPGIMLGEELLVNEFLSKNADQIKFLQAEYLREKEKKQNHSQSNIGRQSPY